MAKSKAQQEQFDKDLAPNKFKSGDEWNGNAKGRPKGTSLTDRLRKLLDQNEGEKAKDVVRAIVEEASKGDPRFAQMIFDRMDGPLKTGGISISGETMKIEFENLKAPDDYDPPTAPEDGDVE